MTDRQRVFAESYAGCGNASLAAEKAGYSKRTAGAQGCRLLKNAEVLDYLQSIQAKASAGRIADAVEVQERLTGFLRDDEEHTQNRIRAGETLLKLGAAQAHQAERAAKEAQEREEAEGTGVVIALPYNGRAPAPNAIELENGEIVPLAGVDQYSEPLIYLRYEMEEPGPGMEVTNCQN